MNERIEGASKNKGNKFWMKRSKHGRSKIFDSADQLWIVAGKYFQWCESNPFLKESIVKLSVNGVGSRVERICLKVDRPFTLKGLCLHLGVNSKYFNQFKTSEDPDDHLSQMVFRIKDIIYNQKFTGAAVGVYNANIISRDLGGTDRSDLAIDQKPFLKHDPFSE